MKPTKHRPTGPVFGALRFVKLGTAFVTGAISMYIAHHKGGVVGARQHFCTISRGLLDIFGVEVPDPPSGPGGALDPEASEVRVSNHSSYLDILVLSTAAAGRFLSRHDVADWPLVGRVAKQIGCVFVERGSKEGRAAGLKALREATEHSPLPLLVFPEGSTSRGELLPFRQGAFLVAAEANWPIRPLAVIYSNRQEATWAGKEPLLPHVWRRLCGDFIYARIVTLPKVSVQASNIQEIAIQTRELIASVIHKH